MPTNSAGGAFQPAQSYDRTGATDTGLTLTAPALTAPVITGAATIATGATLTGPAITAPVISGAATVASGATLTTPTVLFTVSSVTATGATGSAAAALPSVYPALVTATGASGAGVGLPTGAAVAGAFYEVENAMTGALNIYAVGGTINGTTGTTAYVVTATGNKTATIRCLSAGAWRVSGNT